MYHGSRRGGGRAGSRPPPPPPSQPSNAAARAAATAKALHRRAQERARAKAHDSSSREDEPKSDDEVQQQPGGGRRYVIRDHGDPRSDVFRKPKGGNGGRGGGGSILKQLTVGRHKRCPGEANGHGAPEDEPSSTREGADRDAPSRGPPPPGPPPPPGYYPYPPGAYPLPPPGPYGHPPHPQYMYRPYPPPPAGEEGGTAPAEGEAGPPPGYNPYGAPPGPHGYPPYGAPPPGHYPPGYYPPHPPPAEARNGPMKKRAAKRQTSLKDEEEPSPPRDEAYSPKPPGSQSRSTRRVIGSHAAIHVPRATLHDDEGGEGEGDDPLPYKRLKREDSRSVFRTEATGSAVSYGRTASEEREGHASQILLSLSKSFEGAPRSSPSSKGGENGAPMSPHAPPRIQHWHKQATRSDDFEPQPSPPPIKDADPSNIDMKPSFTLFNESFDMNLEGLLGPNASFGLGPMKSLSFGLGLGAGTFDKGEYQQELSKLVTSPTKPERPRGEDGANNGSSKNAVMVLTDARRVRSPLAKDHAVKFEDTEDSHSPQKESKRKARHVPQKIERRLLGAMERHAAVFGLFSYLLPGAHAIFAEETSSDAARPPPLAEADAEVARRRVNASLCAFGGVAVSESDAPPEATNYRETLKERYFEEENRLSWEIEEEPPVEVSDAEDRRPTTTERKRSEEGTSDGLFRTSLQRNMGVMVYPAVNAFTATEPGIITPALNEMNNFVEKGASLPETTPAKAPTESSMATPSVLPLVSPAPDSVSPAVSPDGKTPLRSVNYAGGAWMSNHQSPRKVSPGQKPGGPPTDLLFVDVQALQPEQYRTVAAKQCEASPSRYVYPALPLPYGQRKRISNAMFAMSTSIPGLTDECAAVLGEARRQDAWDFAVAQLMTQVIVVTHCSVEDSRLDGLSQYLLTLGIAC